MHLCHVRAPQHESIGDFEVVVATHRLVHPERPHEAHSSRRHAMARVRIEIVGAETGLEQLVRRVAFPDRPLARPEHADAARSLFASALLNCCAMTSKASSQDTWVNSPSLSYLPFFLRRSGCVRRSSPYMTFERKYPLTQLRPRLTSALVSPWVATTRPSLVATMTPQPVPQNRQGALFHFSSVMDRSVIRFCARHRRWHPTRPLLPSQQLPVSGIHGGPLVSDPYGLLPTTAIVYFCPRRTHPSSVP